MIFGNVAGGNSNIRAFVGDGVRVCSVLRAFDMLGRNDSKAGIVIGRVVFFQANCREEERTDCEFFKPYSFTIRGSIYFSGECFTMFIGKNNEILRTVNDGEGPVIR